MILITNIVFFFAGTVILYMTYSLKYFQMVVLVPSTQPIGRKVKEGHSTRTRKASQKTTCLNNTVAHTLGNRNRYSIRTSTLNNKTKQRRKEKAMMPRKLKRIGHLLRLVVCYWGVLDRVGIWRGFRYGYREPGIWFRAKRKEHTSVRNKKIQGKGRKMQERGATNWSIW